MTYVQVIGYVAAGLGVLMFAMQTMIPLRITGLAHNVGQIAFGLLAGVYPTVIQHTILLPLNSYRLFEMLRLIKQVKAASNSDHSLDWLKPFMTKRSVTAGETLFRKGDEAATMYFLLSGRLHIDDINIDLGAGAVVGELGMLAPGRKRTQTVTCTQDAAIL
jgi:CRP/FNR family transcriptional regulator, cyclic AMP receptor protein